jgi:dTDP-4-amino-4,6-dideoxygalactose transaminase
VPRSPGESQDSTVRLLVPDLPDAEALLPYLGRIDRQRWYTNFGPLVQAFEARCATLLGSEDDPVLCVTASSGTAALELALRALQLPSGSSVLMPSFTFPATAIAVLRAGCTPLLCDVDARSWVLVAAEARAMVARHRVDAIVPVAAFGAGIDVQAWDDLAAETGLPVIVDAAAAFPVERPGKRIVTVYSLHATKPLGVGEGGLVALRDADLAQRIRRLSNYGFESGSIACAGTNAKLSEYAAAVGLAQLDRADAVMERRTRVWDGYREALAARCPGMETQGVSSAAPPANLVVRVPGDAAACVEHLARNGIETRRWYCPAVHAQPAFRELARTGELQVTDDLIARLVGLPFHTLLTEQDALRVVDALGGLVDR